MLPHRSTAWFQPVPAPRIVVGYERAAIVMPCAPGPKEWPKMNSAISAAADRNELVKIASASGMSAVAGIGPISLRTGIPQYRTREDHPMDTPLIRPVAVASGGPRIWVGAGALSMGCVVAAATGQIELGIPCVIGGAAYSAGMQYISH